jgi:hypothetical protein
MRPNWMLFRAEKAGKPPEGGNQINATAIVYHT